MNTNKVLARLTDLGFTGKGIRGRGMSWRTRYLANRLSEKYGVLGRVASKYILAGHSVQLRGDYILVKGRGFNAVITLAKNRKEIKDSAKRAKDIASRLGPGYRPVLVIYGSYRVPGDVLEEVRGEGVLVKRFRP